MRVFGFSRITVPVGRLNRRTRLWCGKSRRRRPWPRCTLRPAEPKPLEKQAPAAESGSSAAAQSGRGEGDITIALQTFFPYPKPNLSVLPHGTKGDVILNAVIDEQGRIADLALVQGLGEQIDGRGDRDG